MSRMRWSGRGWMGTLVVALALLGGAGCGEDAGQEGPEDTAAGDAAEDTAREDAAGDVAQDTAEDADAAEEDGGDDDAGDDDAADAAPIDLTLTSAEEAYAAVDPFIGTGGLGFGYSGLTPAAQRPLGLVRLGPDTTNRGVHAEQQHFGGYYADDPHVRGFSHLHFVGTGVGDYGNLRVTPVGDLEAHAPGEAYAVKVAGSEEAAPGYYGVGLEAPAVGVELTAGVRAALHRYTLAEDGRLHLVIDAASSVKPEGYSAQASVSVEGAEVSGWVVYDGGYTGRGNPFTLYFSIVADVAPAAGFVWDGDGYRPDEVTIEAAQAGGAVLAFDGVAGDAVTLRVGLSFIDLEQARRHREQEADGVGFDAARAAAREAWLDALGRVQLGGADATTQTIFYTALYNLYRMPTRFDASDGRYVGLDARVHEGRGFAYYSDLSLWDTYRTVHPWYALYDQQVAGDSLRSLLAMYEDGGALPRWPSALSYTGGMIGQPTAFLFAEGALKGVEGVDYERALEGLLADANGTTPAGAGFGGRGGAASYEAYGYLPSDLEDESVSRTLEFAHADHALGLLAGHLGRPEAEGLLARGQRYRALFDGETGLFRPRRADGSLDMPFNPTQFDMRSGYYTEGNAWHWRFYVPHDPAGLRELFGGPGAMAEALEAFFAQSQLGGRREPQTLFPDLYYWHGNQPPLNALYMFHAAGAPERLTYWLRQIQTRLYKAAADGLPGNDDGGTLSGWYVFSALGFYPVAGTDRYHTGAPLFPRAVIHLEGGAQITITADGASPERHRVEAVTIDGVAVEEGTFTHAAIGDGASIVFTMGEGSDEASP